MTQPAPAVDGVDVAPTLLALHQIGAPSEIGQDDLHGPLGDPDLQPSSRAVSGSPRARHSSTWPWFVRNVQPRSGVSSAHSNRPPSGSGRPVPQLPCAPLYHCDHSGLRFRESRLARPANTSGDFPRGSPRWGAGVRGSPHVLTRCRPGPHRGDPREITYVRTYPDLPPVAVIGSATDGGPGEAGVCGHRPARGGRLGGHRVCPRRERQRGVVRDRCDAPTSSASGSTPG